MTSALTLLQIRGACRDVSDPEIFHPEREVGAAIVEPMAFCHACPVVHTCLVYALESGAIGIWGATTTRERRRLTRR